MLENTKFCTARVLVKFISVLWEVPQFGSNEIFLRVLETQKACTVHYLKAFCADLYINLRDFLSKYLLNGMKKIGDCRWMLMARWGIIFPGCSQSHHREAKKAGLQSERASANTMSAWPHLTGIFKLLFPSFITNRTIHLSRIKELRSSLRLKEVRRIKNTLNKCYVSSSQVTIMPRKHHILKKVTETASLLSKN